MFFEYISAYTGGVYNGSDSVSSGVGDAVTAGGGVLMGVASSTQLGVGVGVFAFAPPEFGPKSSIGRSEHPAQAMTITRERTAAKSRACLFNSEGLLMGNLLFIAKGIRIKNY